MILLNLDPLPKLYAWKQVTQTKKLQKTWWVFNKRDESHGIPIRKKSPAKKKIQVMVQKSGEPVDLLAYAISNKV